MKIGLTYEDLEQLGFVEFKNRTFDVLEEFKEDNVLSKVDFKTQWNESSHEAIIRAVAMMIEQNNNKLLEQLKSLGVL
ncbi:hypothetical protein PMSD_00490 [Paenibacillus macquariensis subsp. defensor]|nr:hypothetical protein PMSD_00490 [Paenibacillus macquariensis subsp. defensor]